MVEIFRNRLNGVTSVDEVIAICRQLEEEYQLTILNDKKHMRIETHKYLGPILDVWYWYQYQGATFYVMTNFRHASYPNTPILAFDGDFIVKEE